MTTQRKQFSGVAFWKMVNAPSDWIDLATEALQPAVDVGRLVISSTNFSDGSVEFSLRIPEESTAALAMVVRKGNGTGVVRNGQLAVSIVLCLIAVKRKLPNLSLADNDSVVIPTRITQQYPLFGANWAACLDLGSLLGILPSQQFLDSEAGVLQLMF